jgi:hypothetical protein
VQFGAAPLRVVPSVVGRIGEAPPVVATRRQVDVGRVDAGYIASAAALRRRMALRLGTLRKTPILQPGGCNARCADYSGQGAFEYYNRYTAVEIQILLIRAVLS